MENNYRQIPECCGVCAWHEDREEHPCCTHHAFLTDERLEDALRGLAPREVIAVMDTHLEEAIEFHDTYADRDGLCDMFKKENSSETRETRELRARLMMSEFHERVLLLYQRSLLCKATSN